jgi:hypothetical protein
MLSINAHGLWASDALTQTTLFTFRESVSKRIKFEKLSDPEIAFPETLHEKKQHTVNFQESAE